MEQGMRPQWAYPAAQLALAVALALLALPWLTVATPGEAPLAVHGYDFLLGVGAFKPSMTFVLGMLIAGASLVFSFVWRQRGGASLMVGGAAVGGVLVILAVLFAAFSPPKALATAAIQPAIGYWLGLVALVAAFFAGRKAAPEDWRADLPEGVRPYFENAPLASFALGLSSGFPFAMIGATLTSRLKQDGIDKATITAFALAILVYNLKFLWAWIIDGVKLPVLGRLGQRVSWLIVSGILVVAAVANMAFTQADPNNIWPMVTAAVLVGLAGATYDIVIDGYRIEILEPRQLGYGSGMSQYGWRIGSAGAGAVALVVAARFGWEAAYLVCALFALPAIIAGLMIGEPERHRPPAERKGVATVLKSIWGPFVEFFQRQGAWIVLIFILVHKIGDTLANLTFRLLFDDLGFTNDEIAFYDVALGFFAYMIGVFIGGMLYARMGMKRSVLLSLILMAVSNLSFAALAAAGHSNLGMAGAIGFENIASGFGGVVVIAYFSALTDLRFTAAQYALISAGASILGRFLTGTTAGSLIEAMGYVNFYLLTTVIALPGVFIYWWMMRTGLVDRSIGTAGTEGEGGEAKAS
jgi:MFS transporter, PAT family, beta-lactamase induction signal transducer AmpG